MATLNIEGRTVQVDDSFLKLPPDQQNATVDEIAKSLKAMPAPEKKLATEKTEEDKPQRGLMNAITDIPGEIGGAASEAMSNIAGIASRGQKGSIEGLVNTGKAVLGVPQLLMSPITGAARAIGGNLMTQAEHGIGGLIAPDIAAKDDLEKMYAASKGDVDLALSAARPAGAPIKGPLPASGPSLPGTPPPLGPAGWQWEAPAAPAVAATPPRPPSPGQEVVEAAKRASEATGQEIQVPRAIASDNVAVQRIGQGIRNIPVVGDRIPQATGQLVEDLGGAVRSVADQYGAGVGPNVANRIGRTLEDAASAETRTAADAARRSDEALTAAWSGATENASAAVTQREAAALQRARQAVGDMSPQDMGAALIQRLRTGEAAARAEKDALYARAGRMDASIRADEVGTVRAQVAQGLENAGVVVDPQLTPAASRMIDELQNLANLRIPNRAAGAPAGDGQIAGVSVQGIEQARKRLSFFRSAASNDADRRAATNVMRQFDDWQNNAFENALMSGDDAALTAFRQARAANTNWRQRFFNNEDDAGRVIERIVTGEVTPQEVSNYLIGATQIGAKGVSSRLLTRLHEATGGDPEAMQAIRGGIWNRLTTATEGANAKSSTKVANDIGEFLNGSGRDVAERMFTPEQRGIMRAYADTLRRGEETRQIIGEVAKNTKPTSMDVGIGPMQDLASAVLGKGGKPDEALFRTIDAYAKSGGRTDVATLARIVQAIPEKDRGDLAGAIIRNLGVSARTKEFSPDVFVSQWKSYTPQAKAVLFGNAGAQRQALDDIATISERMKDIGKRFGNPSGTAQNANVFAFATWVVAEPISAISSAVGGYGAARILSSPAGASSMSKWAKAYETAVTKPSAQSTRLLGLMSSNLANTAQGLGIQISAPAILRSLQGPVPAGAEGEQPQPPGVRQ